MLGLLLKLENVSASHFRGGIFMVRPQPGVGGTNEMEITFQISWRRSSHNHECTTSVIQSGQVATEGSLTCQSGCSGTIGSLSYQCTDFSATEDWSYGGNTINYTFPSAQNITIGFASCCWITPFNSNWDLQTSFSMTPRSDTNVINSTPRAATSPVVRVQSGCSHKIQIPVSDPDDDIVKCRWGVGVECTGICGGIPGATLDSQTCTISYTASNETGYKAVALAIEDFVSVNSSTPFSTVVLQFLVYVFSSNQSCAANPVFVSPTLVGGVCIAIEPDDTFTTQLRADTQSSSATITDFVTVSPSGTNKGSVYQIQNTNLYYMNISWTPSSAQQDQTHVFCYTALNSYGLTSEQRCIQIDAGLLPPEPNKTTLLPANGKAVPSSNTTWSVEFNKDIQRPSITAHIKFHSATSNSAVYKIDASVSSEVSYVQSNKLVITPNYKFPEDKSFYITFERDVVTSTVGCKPGNEAIDDNDFWIFETQGVTEPVSTSLYPSSLPNLYLGSEVIVVCSATGLPTPIVNWYKDGTLLITNNTVSVTQTNVGNNNITSELTIFPLAVNHEGTYTCKGSNTFPNGTVTESASIIVMEIYGIFVENFTGVALNSTAIYLSWDVLHVPGKMVHQFLVECDELETNREWKLFVVETHVSIFALHPYYSYSFRVKKVGPGNDLYNNSIVVQTHQAAPSDFPTVFNATATSPYLAVFTWEPPPEDGQNGIIIQYVIQVTILETNQTVFLYSNTTYLVVNTLRPYRTYVCIIAARTSIGIGPFGPQFVLLSPEDAPSGSPSLASSLESISITSRGFCIEWDPPSYEEQNGVIRYYIIRLTELETGVVYQYTEYSTNIIITSLHPAYTYEFTIAAFTVGLGPFSELLNITLGEEAPSDSPKQLSGSSLSSSSITLYWNPPPADKQNGVIISYIILLTALDTGMTNNYTAYSTQFTVPGLVPYSTYACRVAAQTSIGTGPFTLLITITTMEDAPSVPPVITVGYSIDSSTVAIQWTPPPAIYHNGIIREYRVLITNLDTGVNETRVFSSTTGIIGSLTPSFRYSFRVTAFTVAESPYSISINITMPEDVPSGFPEHVQGNSSSPDSIYLSWSPPADDKKNGIIIQYIINVTHVDTLNTVQYFTTNTFMYITGLDPYTTYVWVIAAETAVGVGPFSNLFFIQTQQDAPDKAPLFASGIALGPSSIHIAWDPPSVENHNGIIVEYRVNVTQIATQYFLQLITNQTQIVIENLKPYHIYHCYVSAVTVDEGPYTTAITVLTDEAVPSSAPLSLSVSVVDSTSIYLSWSPPLTSDHNGIIRSYSIKVTAISDIYTDVFSFSTLATTFNTSVLSPFTTYSVQVAAVTVATGPFTSAYNVTTQQDVPSSAPQQFNVSARDSSSVQLSWLPPKVSDINGIIQYYNLSFVETETGSVSLKTVYTTSTIISNLHPFYTYKFTVSAVTIGAGPIVSIIIQMLESAPSASPANLIVDNITSSSISFSWDVIPGESQNGIIRYYQVSLTEVDTGTDFTRLAYTNKLTVQDLHPYYTYQVSVAAYTVDIGPYSAIGSYQMKEDVPTSSPTNLGVVVLNSTNTQISWNPPPLSEQNGIITKYNLTVANADTKELLFLITTSTSVNFGGLLPHTIYYCSVSAYTTIGNGPFTLSIYFETNEAAPTSPPKNVQISDISSTDIKITWSKPHEDYANGIIRSYDIKLIELDTSAVILKNTSNTEITVTSLHPYYRYEISVAAVTVVRGPFSSALLVTTEQAAPSSTVQSFAVTALSSRTIRTIWNPPPQADINGIIKYYNVHFFIVETLETFEIMTNKMFLNLNDAHPFYTYFVKVSAVTVAPGPYTPTLNVTTPQDAPTGPPMNVSSEVLNSTAAYVEWLPPKASKQNGIIQKYIISVYEEFSDDELKDIDVYGMTNVTISDLHPYYNYQVTVSAFTIMIGPNSAITFKTEEDLPSSGPLNVTVSNITSTSVSIQWAPPLPHHHNGVIRNYTLSIQEVPTNTLMTFKTSDLFIQLENLHPDYDYEFSISAVTTGAGPSTDEMFKLLEDVPSASPQNVSLISLNATALLVSWEPLKEKDQNGRIRFYKLMISNSDDGNQDLVITVNNNLTSTIVNDLKPFCTYSVQIAAYTIGEGPYSDTQYETMPESVPGESPSEFIGILEQNLTVHFSWISPSPQEINGILLGYEVACTALNQHELAISVLGTSISLHSLQAETHYTCTVCAYTFVGCGPSGTIHISTYEGSPVGPPSSVLVTSVGTTRIILQWKSPFDPDSLVLGYGITYQLYESAFPIATPRPPVTSISESTATEYTINSLLVNTKYRIVVFAIFDEGTGPISEEIIVTTKAEDDISIDNYQCLSVSSDSLSCSWDHPVPSEGYYIAEYQLAHRLADGFDYLPGYGTELERISLSPMTNEYIISELSPYGGYIVELKIILSHEIGSGDFKMHDEVDNITSIYSIFNITQPTITKSTVEGFRVKIISASSVDVYWKPPPRANWNGQLISYSLVFEQRSFNTAGDIARKKRQTTEVFTNKTVMITPKANHRNPSLALEPLNTEHSRLKGLEENFEYHFFIGIVNSKGASELSDPAVMQTMPESAPSGPPINIMTADVTTSSITIEWKPPNPIDANGVIVMYSLNFTRVDIKDTIVKQFSRDQLSYRQQGLQVYEHVSVSIAAKTEVGWGPYSNVYYFSTSEDLPSSPADLKEQVTEDNTVILTWKPPNYPNGLITGYQIIYNGHERSQSSVSDGPHVKFVNSSDHNEIEITNLVKGYFYEFKVQGKNGAGYGENSTVIVLLPSKNKASGPGGVEDDFFELIILATVVASFIILGIIILLVVICIVKRRSKSKSFDLQKIPNGQFSTKKVTMELDLPVLLTTSFSIGAEDNEYDHLTFKPKVKPDLKKKNCNEGDDQLNNDNDNDRTTCCESDCKKDQSIDGMID